MFRTSRRSVVQGALVAASGLLLPASSRATTKSTDSSDSETLAFAYYESEVTWNPEAFTYVNSYSSGSPRVDMIALGPIGSKHSGSISFWLGETEFDGIDALSEYLEHDDKLQYLDGTKIIRTHFDAKRDAACLLFLPEWQGEIDTYAYWEFHQIGEAPNEWAQIKLDGTLKELDADELQERLETVTFDNDPVFTLTDIEEVVEMLDDLKDEYA